MNTKYRYRLDYCAAVLCAILRGVALAQCEGTWLPSNDLAGVGRISNSSDAFVSSFVEWDPDGAGPRGSIIVVGGNFEIAGGVFARNVAAWDPSTRKWSSLGLGLDGLGVQSLTVLPNGDLVAGGSIIGSGEIALGGLAKWNGSSWQPVGGFSTAGRVYALHVAADGKLYVGGNFAGTQVGGVTLNSIATWDGSHWAELQPGFSGSNGGTVYAISDDVDGSVLVGGRFSFSIGRTNATSFARWDGTQWSSLGQFASGAVYSICRLTDGRLLVGGEIGLVNSIRVDGVVTWNGAEWTPLGGVYGIVRTIRELPDGGILAGGSFTQTDAGGVRYVARWDGAAWNSPAVGITRDVLASIVAKSGETLVGGTFTHEEFSGYVASLGTTKWEPVNSGALRAIQSLVVLPSGVVVAGADGRMHSDADSRFIAQWDGVRWSSWNSNAIERGGVRSLHNSNQGGLFAGGNFSVPTSNGSASRIARWGEGVWNRLGEGASGIVRSIASDQSGKLVIGGDFVTVDRIVANGIASWDGATWSKLGAGSSASVRAISVLADNSILATGVYNVPGGLSIGVGRWDGSSWNRMGGDFSGGVANALLRSTSGDIYVAGEFNRIANRTARRVARWDGEAWNEVGGGFDGMAAALVDRGDGTIVAGGSFSVAGSSPASRVASWNGSSWSGLGQGIGAGDWSATVYCLASHPSGELLVGGHFLSAGDKVSARFARWVDIPRPWIAYRPEAIAVLRAENVSVSSTPATGYSNVSFQWKRETIPGVFIDVINGLGGSGGVNGNGAGGTVSGASGSLASPTDGTAATLTITNATPADTGNYKVLFWNTCGEVESVAVKVRVKGHAADINGDGLVDDADFAVFVLQYNTMLCNAAEMVDGCSADFNGDGQVDDADFNILAPAYNIMVF